MEANKLAVVFLIIAIVFSIGTVVVAALDNAGYEVPSGGNPASGTNQGGGVRLTIVPSGAGGGSG